MSTPKNTLYDKRVTSREDITLWTDSYFTNSRQCAERDGDKEVTYAVFVRSPAMFAPDLAVSWLKEVAKKEGFDVIFESRYQPGDIVPAGEAQLYITGPFTKLAECETFLLQKIGAVSVAALNAYRACQELPDIPFIAMGARHCCGTEMQEMMDYAASIGGKTAQRQLGAKGFINGASNATAHFFGQEEGMGTMPHALIGYYDSTLEAAKAFKAAHPEKPFIVLNDFDGKEITDSIDVCQAFPEEAKNGSLGFRLDTNGARYIEGLNHDSSIEVLHNFAPQMMIESWEEEQLKVLYGKGVSVAAIWHFRHEMDKAGFPNIKIIASSGFNAEKCKMMAMAKAPLDGVGTGSYIPSDFHKTYATADIFRYDGSTRVKAGREYLAERYAEQSPVIFDKSDKK